MPASGLPLILPRLYGRYWTALRARSDAGQTGLQMGHPPDRYYFPMSIGRPEFKLTVRASGRLKWIAAEIWINAGGDRGLFYGLRSEKAGIEAEIGYTLDWQELVHRRGSRIEIPKRWADPVDEADWPNQHDWLIDRLKDLDRVFRRRISALPTQVFHGGGPIGGEAMSAKA